MANWQQATVLSNHFWTDNLFSLKVELPPQNFIAGQFVKLGLDINDKRIQRAYSLVNPPNTSYAEFYLTNVADGLLSPKLAALQPGDSVQVSSPATGFFTLEEVPDGECLWLLSTGTGIGPFLSILGTDAPWQRFKHIVLVHAARFSADLSYQALIESMQQQHPAQLRYIPVVSREAYEQGLNGRIPQLIQQNELQKAANHTIDKHSQVMMCGNPDMIKECKTLLESMGLTKNLRRQPGQITVEQYW
ncbi:ferredoxin--NADP reductase [Neptunicella marina]|uniref:ferredoxin--NADP(+) reductase n=1 Tax=Neptunicella marina TaxID=2125989 RepID=A0A8J6M2U8_9ALTE|nr:ferredoxin--NADP reductase [Neptunicella marina]MBC3766537.1 ferredoxin--NADP reductase [Neptunicella marina]